MDVLNKDKTPLKNLTLRTENAKCTKKNTSKILIGIGTNFLGRNKAHKNHFGHYIWVTGKQWILITSFFGVINYHAIFQTTSIQHHPRNLRDGKRLQDAQAALSLWQGHTAALGTPSPDRNTPQKFNKAVETLPSYKGKYRPPTPSFLVNSFLPLQGCMALSKKRQTLGNIYTSLCPKGLSPPPPKKKKTKTGEKIPWAPNNWYPHQVLCFWGLWNVDIFKSRFQGEKALFYPGERIASRFSFKNNPSATFISPSGGACFCVFFPGHKNSIPGTLPKSRCQWIRLCSQNIQKFQHK